MMIRAEVNGEFVALVSGRPGWAQQAGRAHSERRPARGLLNQFGAD